MTANDIESIRKAELDRRRAKVEEDRLAMDAAYRKTQTEIAKEGLDLEKARFEQDKVERQLDRYLSIYGIQEDKKYQYYNVLAQMAMTDKKLQQELGIANADLTFRKAQAAINTALATGQLSNDTAETAARIMKMNAEMAALQDPYGLGGDQGKTLTDPEYRQYISRATRVAPGQLEATLEVGKPIIVSVGGIDYFYEQGADGSTTIISKVPGELAKIRFRRPTGTAVTNVSLANRDLEREEKAKNMPDPAYYTDPRSALIYGNATGWRDLE